jgi:hypothetical protein
MRIEANFQNVPCMKFPEQPTSAKPLAQRQLQRRDSSRQHSAESKLRMFCIYAATYRIVEDSNL